MGWLAGSATVVTAAILVDSLQQSDAVLEEDEKYSAGEDDRSGLMVS